MTYEELKKISKIRFVSDELNGNEVTIKQFLQELLCTLWDEKDQFSGKAPFGNSSWEYEIYKVLVERGIVKGTIDEYGDIEEFDTTIADSIINDIIVEVM